MDTLVLVAIACGISVALTVLVMDRKRKPDAPAPVVDMQALNDAYLDGVQVGLDAAEKGLTPQFRKGSVVFGENRGGVFAGMYVASYKRGVRALFKVTAQITEEGAAATAAYWTPGTPPVLGMLHKLPNGRVQQFVTAPDGDGFVLVDVQ